MSTAQQDAERITHLDTESDTTNGTRYELQFTQGFFTVARLRCRDYSFEGALEQCAEWLGENAPGLLSSESELAEDGAEFDDGMPIDYTYTEAGYLESWSWTGGEI